MSTLRMERVNKVSKNSILLIANVNLNYDLITVWLGLSSCKVVNSHNLTNSNIVI